LLKKLKTLSTALVWVPK